MSFKNPGLRRAFCALAVLCALGLLLSCNSYNSNRRLATRSGLPFRVFVSNPTFPNALGGGSPALEVIDGTNDRVSGYNVALSTLTVSINDAGMMAVSPNRDRTLVMSPSDSKMGLIDNAKEQLVGAISLPGFSESFFIANDNASAFVAVPSAPVTGQAPGVVEKLDTNSGSVSAIIPVPGARYLVPNASGSQILVFSDNSDSVILLTPSLINSNSQQTSLSNCTNVPTDACILLDTFDRPVSAVFDPSGNTAYVVNCGPECGGSAASISVVNVAAVLAGQPAVSATVTVPAATTALLQGNTLYVTGTQIGVGGDLTVLNLASGAGTVVCSSPTANCQVFPISDGHHTKMAMGSNGQLFIGSKTCSSVCLTIFNTLTSKVVPPPAPPAVPDQGDVTGIEPISNRNVVYVCVGGRLRVYDTTTDALEVIPPPYGQPNIIGQAIDAKVIDF